MGCVCSENKEENLDLNEQMQKCEEHLEFDFKKEEKSEEELRVKKAIGK